MTVNLINMVLKPAWIRSCMCRDRKQVHVLIIKKWMNECMAYIISYHFSPVHCRTNDNHLWSRCGLLYSPPLRSAEQRVCSVPHQSFAAAGPRAWNELPFSLRDTGLSLTTFNAHLKTYLFSTAFEATVHLWHWWFICAAYKCTYLLT